MSRHVLTLFFIFSVTYLSVAHAIDQDEGDWFISAIHAPEGIKPTDEKDQIVIAVVDDGVRTGHQDLKKFIWKNPGEIPLNGIDDDGNGFTDDLHGWDVADHNSAVNPPEKRLKDFYHGTHIAGIVMQIAKKAYGDAASKYIKILPVKSLSDRAQQTYLKDGYRGIEYAVRAGADIIIASWGLGRLSSNEARVLQNAKEQGVLVVASAGNFPDQREQFPAAFDPVLAVAALDRKGGKIEKSNYGEFVDFSAPGIGIRSTSVLGDDRYEVREGTSTAAPMAAAAAALVKLQFPQYSWQQVTACLKSSTDPVDAIEYRYTGKLGSGILNISEALRCKLFNETKRDTQTLVHPQGYLYLNSQKSNSNGWLIQPSGRFKGLRFKPLYLEGPIDGNRLNFYSNDRDDRKLIAAFPLDELPESIYVPGNSAYVTLETENGSLNISGLVAYRVETIDFSSQYCSGTKYIDTEGDVEDGSGKNNYAFDSDCKWLITAPEGKVIKIKFNEFDTEARTDLVYFFNGTGTHEKIMAIFSGPKIPPELTTWSNQVLVWFVTDGKNQGKGWKGEIKFLDPPANPYRSGLTE